MKTYERILVPLDGSEVSERILPEIEKIADKLKANISIMRVAFIHPIPAIDITKASDVTKAEVAVVHEAEEYVHMIEEKLKAKGFTVGSHVRYGPDAADEILDHTDQYDTDLIMMSTHGRSGVKRWLLGSVAEKVVHHATTPVLLVRVR